MSDVQKNNKYIGSIVGIGCDIVSLSHIDRLRANPHFLKKVYTPYEREYLARHSAQTAAGLWAAKEAVSKAIGTGFAGFAPKNIEIKHHKSGQPYVLLHKGAERIAAAHCIGHIHLSISHEREQALAFAIAEIL